MSVYYYIYKYVRWGKNNELWIGHVVNIFQHIPRKISSCRVPKEQEEEIKDDIYHVSAGGAGECVPDAAVHNGIREARPGRQTTAYRETGQSCEANMPHYINSCMVMSRIHVS